MSRPNSAAIKDVNDVSISPIFCCYKYRYRIGIGKDDINPSLIETNRIKSPSV